MNRTTWLHVGAAVLSYAIAEQLVNGAPPVLAPLTVLLVVQSTLYETLTSGLQRIASVVLGVVIALLVAAIAGLTWWSLGIVVLTALVIGSRLRLGPQLVEVPISGMIVLAVSFGTQTAALGRVAETLIGAAVGVAVRLLTRPVYVRPAGDAIRALAQRISALLRQVGGELEQEWTPERAEAWLAAARALSEPVARAREALDHAEDSLRLNPRRRRAEALSPHLMSALTALEHTAINVRVSCRMLGDRAPGPEVRLALAQLFDACADAVAEFGALAEAPDDTALRVALERARLSANIAAKLLVVDGRTDPSAWRDHGALLANLDRLLGELTPPAPWPEPAPRRRAPSLRVARPSAILAVTRR